MPDFDRLRRLLKQQAGDPLGLRLDAEASIAIADTAARRFIATDHSP